MTDFEAPSPSGAADTPRHLHRAPAQRTPMEADLRVAAQRGQLELFYQPQVDRGGRLVGAEALLRWRHPSRGLLSPADFLPLAEATGLIIPIGRWVLDTACAQLKRWAGDPALAHLQLAVNASALQLAQPHFAAQVAWTLAVSGVDPRSLKIELAESTVRKGSEDALRTMGALKGLGVEVVLECTGSDRCGIAHVRGLPFEQLKLGCSIIGNLPHKRNDVIAAQALIAMANAMSVSVLAEGVETPAQQQFLAVNGCSLFQGHLYARALPVDVFEAFAHDRQRANPFPTTWTE